MISKKQYMVSWCITTLIYLIMGGGYPNAVMSTFEVIGNIYENPELMEVSDDQ